MNGEVVQRVAVSVGSSSEHVGQPGRFRECRWPGDGCTDRGDGGNFVVDARVDGGSVEELAAMAPKKQRGTDVMKGSRGAARKSMPGLWAHTRRSLSRTMSSQEMGCSSVIVMARSIWHIYAEINHGLIINTSRN